MPVYEYECSNGHRHEVIHGIEAAGPVRCPVCGAPVHKLIARPAIVFKGSGWAKKDARVGARSAPGPDAGPAGEGAPTSAAGDTDGQPATASATDGGGGGPEVRAGVAAGKPKPASKTKREAGGDGRSS